MHLSQRVQNLKPYPFARMAEKIAALKARGVDVIRMDIGSPDMPPAEHILAAAEKAVRDPGTHGYPAFGYGTPALLAAVAEYYGARFGVALDPKREITALLGSKEGIFHLTQALLQEGEYRAGARPGLPGVPGGGGMGRRRSASAPAAPGKPIPPGSGFHSGGNPASGADPLDQLPEQSDRRRRRTRFLREGARAGAPERHPSHPRRRLLRRGV